MGPATPVSLFGVFARIGGTAFGGGTATLVAIRGACVEDRHWLSEEEYLDSFVLSRLTPGINILAQVILIGMRTAGPAGAVAGIVGLMLPAVGVTAAMCVGYHSVAGASWAHGPLVGLAAAVAGFTVSFVLQLGRGVIRRSRRWLDLPVALGMGVAVTSGVHPLVVLGGGLAAGLLLPAWFTPDPGSAAGTDPEADPGDPGAGPEADPGDPGSGPDVGP